MYLRSTMLLFWAGVCAASLAAAVLVVAAEVCTTVEDFAAGPSAPVCRAAAGWPEPGRSGTVFIPASSA